MMQSTSAPTSPTSASPSSPTAAATAATAATTATTTPSFLQRWTQEASNVLSDMYGNLVLGDDVGGDSQRLVVVLQPRPMKNAAGLRSSSSSLRRFRPSAFPNPLHPQNNGTNNNSSNGQTNGLKSAPTSKHLSPHQQQQQLALMMMMMHSSNLLHLEETMGMSLVEINGKSYVHSVVPGGQAHQAGVQVQDCIQYAAAVEPSSATHNGHGGNGFGSEGPPVLTESMTQHIHQQAIEEEKRGTRIPHDQLVRLIQGNLYEATQFTSQQASQGQSAPPNTNSIPLTIDVVGRRGASQGRAGSHKPSSAATGALPSPNPMVFVLLRTRQRTWGETLSAASSPKPFSATGQSNNDSRSQTLAHQQSQQKPSPIGTSLSQASFGATLSPLHWRMDDECDFATTLIRSLIPNNNDSKDHLQNWSNTNAGTANHGALGNGASSNAPSDLATIRMHISQAVGIAVVHASKFGVGLSVHGGSGVVLARLSDGTWSAPSAIGVWGLGIGVSVGLEMAQYLLVLPTQESLSHFIHGGSFAIGGTVGASLGGHGKESYGAASLSGAGAPALCGTYDMTAPSTVPTPTSAILSPASVGGTVTGNHAGNASSAGPYKSSNSLSKFGGGTKASGGAAGGGTVLSGSSAYNPTAEDEYYHDPDGMIGSDSGNETNVDPNHSADLELNDIGIGPNLCNSAGAAAAAESRPGASSSVAGICPLLAYTTQSQGFFVGASLEGSRIVCRTDMNQRAYKFATLGQSVTAHDILTGKVATPSEAEPLYAALHALELAHEVSTMKPPPAMLLRNVSKDWTANAVTICGTKTDVAPAPATDTPTATTATASVATATMASKKANDSPTGTSASAPAAVGTFWETLTDEEIKQCTSFERQAKKFLYGGVSVQRIILPSTPTTSFTGPAATTVRRERRTLWLMLPEVGSLRLGFVSKASDDTLVAAAAAAELIDTKKSTSSVSSAVNSFLKNPLSRWQQYQLDQDAATVDDEVTLDSALLEKSDPTFVGQVRTGNVELSKNRSVALTDITLLTQFPSRAQNLPPGIAKEIKAWDESKRMVVVQDCMGTTLLFLANSTREADLVVCGMRLLLERETARIGVRGGKSLGRIKGSAGISHAMSPSAARGGSRRSGDKRATSSGNAVGLPRPGTGRRNSGTSSRSSSSSVEDEDQEEILIGEVTIPSNSSVPEGWGSWGRVPGRKYMRGQAASTEIVLGGASSSRAALEKGVPRYIHGQLLVRDVVKNIHLPLPLPLCRVLLLDSTSPVISTWEEERGDVNFETTPWTFPPATPREMEHHPSEHQLIASGSMCGAHRTVSFERLRNGNLIRLAEMWKIDSDDSQKMAFTVTERLPRRGFSIKVKVVIRSFTSHSCEATVLGELRPVGKNMANQAAVHKAFLMVLDELKVRYGLEGPGLLGGFLKVVNSMPDDSKHLTKTAASPNGRSIPKLFQRTAPPLHEEKKDGDGDGRMSSRSGNASDAAAAASTSAAASAAAAGEVDAGVDSDENDKGVVSFEEMLKTNKIPDAAPDKVKGPIDRPRPSGQKGSRLKHPEPNPAKRIQAKRQHIKSDTFEVPQDGSKDGGGRGSGKGNGKDEANSGSAEPVMIEVKPLPKIRLSLMPAPREEDEDMVEEGSGEAATSPKKSKRKAKTKKKSKKGSSSTSSSKKGSSSTSSSKKTGSGWKKGSKLRSI